MWAAHQVGARILLGADASAASKWVSGAAGFALTVVSAETVNADRVSSTTHSSAVVDVKLTLGARVSVVARRTDAARSMVLHPTFGVLSTSVREGAGVDTPGVIALLVPVTFPVRVTLGFDTFAVAAVGSLVTLVTEAEGLVAADLAGGVLVAEREVAGVDALSVRASFNIGAVLVEPAPGHAGAVNALNSVLAIVGSEAGRAAEAVLGAELAASAVIGGAALGQAEAVLAVSLGTAVGRGGASEGVAATGGVGVAGHAHGAHACQLVVLGQALRAGPARSLRNRARIEAFAL